MGVYGAIAPSWALWRPPGVAASEVLDVALQFQPPPEDCGGRDLAGVQPRGLALAGAIDLDPEVEVAGWLPGERLAGFRPQRAGDVTKQRPGQYR
jgi:hypothetical protein